MKRWNVADELARKNTAHADDMCRGLFLKTFTEDERFGRYYLSPRDGDRFASYTWVEVVVLRHGVLVHGDCEAVTFKGFHRKDAGPRASLYWMGTHNYGYAESKVEQWRKGHSREWDHAACRQ